jgi:hypothetical protein
MDEADRSDRLFSFIRHFAPKRAASRSRTCPLEIPMICFQPSHGPRLTAASRLATRFCRSVYSCSITFVLLMR